MTEPIPKRLQIWPGDAFTPEERASTDDTSASESVPPTPPSSQLDLLRDLLVGPERARLSDLELRQETERLTAEKLSAMLPQAVQESTHQGERLAEALSPTLNQSFREMVKSDPQALVDVISPVLFPTIRAAIRDAVRSMVQTLNNTLESSMSWHSVAWRVESWRTGHPFAEVVLLHSLLYRVEQVCLIHRQTGLLLRRATLGADTHNNADVVAGMMTALQDFARDSFQTPDHDGLSHFQVGDTTVWAAQGSQAALCAVVRGSPPAELHEALREANQKLHSQFFNAFRSFQGNSEPFEACQPHLESCLLSAYQPQKASPFAKMVARVGTAVILISLLAGLGWGLWSLRAYQQRHRLQEFSRLLRLPATVQLSAHGHALKATGTASHAWLEFARDQSRSLLPETTLSLDGVTDKDASWIRFVEKLHTIPGLVITQSEVRGDDYVLEGLKDPLVSDPLPSASEYGIDSKQIHATWTAFHSLDPGIAQQRLLELLDPPPGVIFTVREGTIIFTGVASHAWIEKTRGQADALSSQQPLDLSQVEDEDLRLLRALCAQIENIAVPLDETEVLGAEGEESLAMAYRQIESARQQAENLNQSFRLIVVGDAENRDLAKERARRIGIRLLKLGLSRDIVVIATRDSLARESQKPPVNGCRFNVKVGLYDW